MESIETIYIMADSKEYKPVEMHLPQSGTFHYNSVWDMTPGTIKVPLNPRAHRAINNLNMSRRIYQDNVYITQAANGYIVHLPSLPYGPDAWEHERPDLRDNLQKLFTLKNLALMAQIVQRIKEGKDYTDLIPAETPPADNEPELQQSMPENNQHIFSTWQEASDFMKQFYEN